MIDNIFIVLLISGVFNFWYIWFHGKNEKVCKRLIKVSSIFLLPRVLQSFYSFTLESPVFSSTLFIVLGFLFNLIITSLMISFIILALVGAFDDIVIKRLKERERK